MDLKTALNQLKKVGPAVKLQFLYIEADAKGKPVVLVGNSIATEKEKVLKTAKIKHTATGKMALSASGELSLQARGDGMSTLKANMTKAVKVAGSVVKSVTLGAPEAEEAPAAPAASAAPAPAAAPAAQTPPPSTAWQQATGRSDAGKGSFLGNQRAAATPPAGPTNQPAAATPSARQANYVDDLNLGASKAAKPGQATYDNTLDLREAQAAKSKSAGDGQATYVDTLDLRAAKAAKSKPADDGQATYVDNLDLREEKPATAKSSGDGKATYEDLLDLRKEEAARGGAAAPAAQPGGKKFADPAPVTPARAELNRLIAQRDKLQNALDFTEKDNKKEKPTDAVLRAAAKIREMDKEIRGRLVQLNDTGFAAKAMHSDYEGEDEKAGWKAGAKPKMPELTPGMKPEAIEQALEKHRNAVATWEEYRESDISLRKNFSAEERADSKMSVDEFGRLRDAQGNPVTADAEYVMDAEEGKFHQFQPASEKTGEYQTFGPKGKSFDGEKRTHHSSVLSGADVAGAGGIKAKQGEVTMVTNLSGHYRPGVGQTIQTVEELLKLGALLDKTWVDKDGNELEDKVLDLYTRTRGLQKTLTAKLQADPQADVKQDQKNLDAAMAMCRKLGLGPANRIRDNARVGMIETTPDMTGVEIKAAEDEVENNAIPAKDFLQSGGGNDEQKEAKDEMMDELEQRMKKRKARLDAAAKTGVGPAPVTEEELEAQVDALDTRAPQRRARAAARREAAAPAEVPAGDGQGATGKANYTDVVLEEKPEDGEKAAGGGKKAQYVDNLSDVSKQGSAGQGATVSKANYVQPDLGGDEEEAGEAASGTTEKTNYAQPDLGAEEKEEAETTGGKTNYVQPDIGAEEAEEAETTTTKTNYVQPDLGAEEAEEVGGREANYTEPDLEEKEETQTTGRKAAYTDDPFKDASTRIAVVGDLERPGFNRRRQDARKSGVRGGWLPPRAIG